MPDYTFPVLYDGARISSDIGPRSAPLPGASTNHAGIDIAAPTGAPVVAPIALDVTFAGQARGYGNVIYGVDPYGNQHRFAHLNGFNVQTGDTIGQGGRLGSVGSTGNSTGPHLHYEVRNKAGEFLADKTRQVISGGKSLARSAIDGFLKSNPATAPFAIGADVLGIDLLGGDGGCGVNPICHLRKWLEETSFITRAAFFIIATIFIAGGIAFLALGYNPKNLASDALKAVKT